MTKRRLFISLIVLFNAIVFFNWFVGRASRTLPRILLSDIARTSQVDYLVLGNSISQCAFSEAAFLSALPKDAATGRLLNLGCSNTTPAETIQFYLAAKRKFPKIPCVIIGYKLDEPTASTYMPWGGLVAHTALFYYTDFELGLSLYQPKTFLQELQFRMTRYLPMIYERNSIWKRVELLRRNFAGWGMPPSRETSFGRVDDFLELQTSKHKGEQFDLVCKQAMSERIPLTIPFREIIRQARQCGSSVFLVEMPLPPALRNTYAGNGTWDLYRNYVRELIQAEGAHYIDALNWFSDEQFFGDVLHMSPLGADEFSRRMAPIVIQRIGK